MSMPMLIFDIALFIVLVSVSLLILVVRCLLCIAVCLEVSFGGAVIIISSWVDLQRLSSVLKMQAVMAC